MAAEYPCVQLGVISWQVECSLFEEADRILMGGVLYLSEHLGMKASKKKDEEEGMKLREV